MTVKANDLPPVIIGAGPAGLAAAKAFVSAGIRPIVIEENNAAGGQGTRRLNARMQPLGSKLFGKRYYEKAVKREAEEDNILSQCDYRPNTMVWAIYNNEISAISADIRSEVNYSQLLIAIGATDRVLAVEGWQKAGVYSLGGAQVALKTHASAIGTKIVFAGSSPLLYLAAAQYARLGYKNITILDTTPFSSKAKAALKMALYSFKTFTDGLRLIAELKGYGVRILNGVQLISFEGGSAVEAVNFLDKKRVQQQEPCNAVAFGFGLRSETQLAELAGAKFGFDDDFRQWFVQAEACGRAGSDLWVAGDSSAIGGADAAAASGRLAALSMLRERNITIDTAEFERLSAVVKRLRNFQREMTTAFRWPYDAVKTLSDEAYVCRCERVTAGEIRNAIKADLAHTDVNRIKAITRCGMGRCQGRYCNQTIQELAIEVSGLEPQDVGRLRAQAPFRPIPVGTVDGATINQEKADA